MSNQKWRLALWLCGIALVVGVATPAAAQPYSVRVTTKMNEQGFVDADSKARTDSVGDVTKALRDKKYKDLFVVTDKDDSDLVIEVAWRGKITTDKTSGSTTVVPGTLTAVSDSSHITQDNLKLNLLVGTYQQEFWALEPGKTDWLGGVPQAFWSVQAKDAVSKIAKWATENKVPLVAAIAKKTASSK